MWLVRGHFAGFGTANSDSEGRTSTWSPNAGLIGVSFTGADGTGSDSHPHASLVFGPQQQHESVPQQEASTSTAEQPNPSPSAKVASIAPLTVVVRIASKASALRIFWEFNIRQPYQD
jgi:hypothetical protein